MIAENKVRLEPWELKEIIKSFEECFNEDDRLWLFGSRANLNKRGGDIDLYIEVIDFDPKKVHLQRQNFWILLQDKLGEQKIDIVIQSPELDLLIYKIAKAEGVQLV